MTLWAHELVLEVQIFTTKCRYDLYSEVIHRPYSIGMKERCCIKKKDFLTFLSAGSAVIYLSYYQGFHINLSVYTET